MSAVANPSNGGTVTQTAATSNGHWYDAGTLVSVFEQAAAGFTFTGWSGVCSGTAACFVTMNSPASVTANFTRPTYLVTINVPAGVQYSLSGLPLTGSASIALPAGNWDLVLASPQAAGAGVQTAFVSWSDGGAASHTITVVSSPVTVTGTFKTQYLLTTATVPANAGVAGAGAPGPSDPWYDVGAAVILQATPNAGYDFLYWGGACSGSNSQCFLVMSGPKTATANFSLSLKWIPLFPATSPAPREDAVMVYDAARQQVVLFGGTSRDGLVSCNDTWVWDGLNWTQRSPAHNPPAGAFFEMAYDAVNQQTVLLTGPDVNSSAFVPGETWMWDGTDWTQKFPAASPTLRGLGGMAYDAVRQRVVLFGGQYHGLTFKDTWTWDGTNWTQMFPAISPPDDFYQNMTWDAARQEVLVFGIHTDSLNTTVFDTWTWNGTTWSQKAPVSNPALFSSNTPLVYDALTQQVVLPVPDGALPGVTWFWDGTNWAQKVLPVSPPPRAASAGAYDALRQQLVLFGGNSPAGNDTWIYAAGINPPQYTLTSAVTPAGSGSLAQSAPGQPGPAYYAGTPVTVTATPAAGYGLQSWSGACSGSGACVVTMDADKSVSATFTNAPINVTINVPPTVQFAIDGTTYTGSQTVVLTPGTYPLTMTSLQASGPGAQLLFSTWSDTLKTASRNVVVGGVPLTITAIFKTQYLLTTAVSLAAAGNILPASGYYDAGTILNVTALANAGYTFVNWSGACSGGGACSVTMTGPKP